MSVTYNGGTFERFLYAGPPSDCFSDIPVPDPTPAQLKCLTFSLPSSVTVPSDDVNTDNALTKQMTFSDTSSSCGGSDLVTRLSTVYGHNVTGLQFNIDNIGNAEPYDITALKTGFDLVFSSEGKRSDPTGHCEIGWIPTERLVPGQYVLEYKSPVCGASGPILLHNSQENRVKLSIAMVNNNREISMMEANIIDYFSEVFEVPNAAIEVQVLSNVKFSLKIHPTVTDRKQMSRTFSLINYNIGKQPLLPGANLKDGCIDELTISFGPMFTNTSEACGAQDAGSRFQRYFGGFISPQMGVMNEAEIYLNFTVGIGGRRALGDLSFYYFDKPVIPTTATTTTSGPTTLSSSTLISTGFISSTVSVTPATTAAAVASAKDSAASSAVASVASNAITATVATAASVPTGYAAPTGNGGSIVYGVPTVANNIYKSSSVGTVGITSAFIVSYFFAF